MMIEFVLHIQATKGNESRPRAAQSGSVHYNTSNAREHQVPSLRRAKSDKARKIRSKYLLKEITKYETACLTGQYIPSA